MLVDSHCHLDCLDLTPYQGSLARAIAAARTAGIECMLCPAITLTGVPKILEITAAYKNIFAAIGVHPNEQNAEQPTIAELVALGESSQVIGVGETGLDFYYNKEKEEKERQKKLFKLHIAAAKILQKPLIVHARDAAEEVVELIAAEEGNISGVMHCFTGSWEFATKMLALGFYISFSGIITFPKAAQLREVAQQIPAERLLIETDAPYLAPVPYRGKPNEPAYLPYIATTLATLRKCSYEELAAQTTENFKKFTSGKFCAKL